MSWREKAAKDRPGRAHSQLSLRPQQDDRRARSVIFESLEADSRKVQTTERRSGLGASLLLGPSLKV